MDAAIILSSKSILDSDIGEDMGYKAPDKPGEIALWRAVLVRAIKDAVGADQKEPHRAKEYQEDAQRWFYEGEKDFELVCNHADLDPEIVQHAVLDFITMPNREKRTLSCRGKRPGSKRSNRQDLAFAA